MVRHDIYDHSKPVPAQHFGKTAKFVVATKFGIDAGRMDDVVAVLRSRSCSLDGRRGNVADAEFGEIGRKGLRVGKGKAAMELEAHCGVRHIHRAPRLASVSTR